MLARQAWRLLIFPDTLCARVLRAKYYVGKTILEASAKAGISYTWRSILKGANLLKEGIVWRIGNGTSVNIWSDPWIPRDISRWIITPRRGSLLLMVAELINPITGTWDEQLVKETFWDEDANIILALPISQDIDDFPAWHPYPKGVFSVKSAYTLGIRIRDHHNGADASTSNGEASCFDWKRVWRMNVANKVKVFVWQLAHNSLQVKKNIARRGVKLDTLCPICQRFDEDMGHLFLKCKTMRLCWLLLNLEEVRVSFLQLRTGRDMLEKIWTLQDEIQQKIILLLWCWWSARNKANAGERMKSAQEVVSDVFYHMNAWNSANHQKNHSSKLSGSQTWKAPPDDFYKINCDGSFLPGMCRGGWGFVIRNHLGQVAAAGVGPAAYLLNAQHAEA